jgi:hypothetical protein
MLTSRVCSVHKHPQGGMHGGENAPILVVQSWPSSEAWGLKGTGILREKMVWERSLIQIILAGRAQIATVNINSSRSFHLVQVPASIASLPASTTSSRIRHSESKIAQLNLD